MFQPLKGIKVIDLSLAGCGPSATKVLAEYGADVIWVEPPWGTSTRTVHKFDFYTVGKRSITLNLKAPEGHDVMVKLLETADIFVSNYRPGGIRRLGLDYESVKKINPKIVYATVNGYGDYGEERDLPGYDTNAFWAEGGLLKDFAEEGTILVPPAAVGDIATGLTLAGGIMAAMYNREKTGEGCHVFTSLLAQAVYMNHDALVEVQYGEKYPKSRKAPRRSLLNTYQCGDGGWITIAVTVDFERYFPGIMRAIGREDLIGDPRFQSIDDTTYARAPEMVRILDEGFAKLTQAEALKRLQSADIPAYKVQGTADLLDDPQVHANNMIYQLPVTTPPKENQECIYVPATPVKFDTLDSGVACNVTRGPRLGENTTEILKEYGYSDEAIASMAEKHITTLPENYTGEKKCCNK